MEETHRQPKSWKIGECKIFCIIAVIMAVVEVLRVKTDTDMKKLSRSIIRSYEDAEAKKEAKSISLRAIGAGALNQAVKAVIESNSHFSKKGLSIRLSPSFVQVSDDPSKQFTGVELLLVFDRV